MAKKKKRSTRRRRSSFGGGTFGIDFQEAAYSAAAGFIGTWIKARLPAGVPAWIAASPSEALGLYTIGVLLKKKNLRSVGAGLAIGQAFGAATA